MKFGKRVSNIIKKEFESNLGYNKKYIKTKIKSYNTKTNTTFQSNKIPKGSQYIFLLVILLDSVDENDYYPQDCYP